MCELSMDIHQQSNINLYNHVYTTASQVPMYNVSHLSEYFTKFRSDIYSLSAFSSSIYIYLFPITNQLIQCRNCGHSSNVNYIWRKIIPLKTYLCKFRETYMGISFGIHTKIMRP
jgi:hypothetical protein